MVLEFQLHPNKAPSAEAGAQPSVLRRLAYNHPGLTVDLGVGQEDGRVALVEHTGTVARGVPVFAERRFFRQKADAVKFGALVTPVGFDWDGRPDLLVGAEDGFLYYMAHPTQSKKRETSSNERVLR